MKSNRSRVVRVAGIALACGLVPASAVAAAADFYLKIDGVDGESKATGHKGEIEVQSYSWGVSQSSSAAAGTGLGAGKASMSDLSIMRTTAAGGVAVAAGDVDGDGSADAAAHTVKAPRDAASGMASGKRTHKPVRLSAPLGSGSVSVAMKLPGCAVGTRYPAAELTTPTGHYALQDVVVASCGGGTSPSGEASPMEHVSLNYTKIQLRGWDPKKKEE